MSFGTFLAFAALALLALGAYIGYRANAPERKRLREIDEKEAASKAKDEQEGRERAQRDYEKLQFQRQLEGLLQGHVEPDRQYGLTLRGDAYRQFPAIYKVLEAVRNVQEIQAQAEDFRLARNAYRKNIAVLQDQITDLQKTLDIYTG